MMCRDYHTLYGRPYTVLRYGIPYGPRMRDNCVAAAFFKRAFRGEPLRIDGDGCQERFFVYVEDLARAHVLALDPIAENRPSTSTATSRSRSGAIAETVRDLVGDVDGQLRAAPPRRPEGPGGVAPTGPARSSAGSPEVSFDEGMQRTLRLVRRDASACDIPRSAEPVTLED